jgi:hypothetical protein
MAHGRDQKAKVRFMGLHRCHDTSVQPGCNGWELAHRAGKRWQMNPLDLLADKLAELKHQVFTLVMIDLEIEAVKVALSRLTTLDPESKAKYQAALDALDPSA